MADRNWDAELAKIDKQIASTSDQQLLAASGAAQSQREPTGTAPGAAQASGRGAVATRGSVPPAPAATISRGRSWVAWLKVLVALAAAVGLTLWPWDARCGMPLIGYTATTAAVSLLGIWSALSSWKHRLGWAHFASLLVMAWGITLGAREILPRVGYAIPTATHSASWTCDGIGGAEGSTVDPQVDVTPPTPL